MPDTGGRALNSAVGVPPNGTLAGSAGGGMACTYLKQESLRHSLEPKRTKCEGAKSLPVLPARSAGISLEDYLEHCTEGLRYGKIRA